MPERIDIFLVEDSSDDATFFLHALAEAKIQATVKTASDGAMALTMMFGKGKPEDAVPLLHPRLIVLDLKLPKVNGIDVLRRLKNNPHTKSFPVVVLSSSQEKRDLAACYQLNVNGFVVKPMEFDQFGETVRVLTQYWLQFNRAPE